MEVYLYAKCTSKLSCKRDWWEWTTYQPIHSKQKNIPMIKTNIKIDISELKHTFIKGIGYRVIVKNKAFNRKLMSMSSLV